MGGCFAGLVWLAFLVLIVAAMWKVFEKAGQPGWAALVPIYNLVILCQIAGKPGWWVLLMLIPLVNVVIAAIVAYGLARNFGYAMGMTLLLVFLPFIGYPLLAFGDCEYEPV
jgi:hypothetical protein